jgi:hypothetical protein
MKIWRHKLENNTINSVLDSGSNNTITKKICPKGPKLCSAKCMAKILVKNVGALDTDCAKFDSHIYNKHTNPPPFPPSMLCVVFYTSKVLHNIDKGDRGCLDMKFCIKWASMYMVIWNEVKVMLFTPSGTVPQTSIGFGLHFLRIVDL